MGVAARLGNQWAMTQYRVWRLRDWTYRLALSETHPVLLEAQNAKFAPSTQRRVEAANAVLSLAKDKGVRVDQDRLLWLVGTASAQEAKWEAETIAIWETVDFDKHDEALDSLNGKDLNK